MHIGALAKQVGASPKAIRLYESLGLLGPVSRQGVYRVYSPQQVERDIHRDLLECEPAAASQRAPTGRAA